MALEPVDRPAPDPPLLGPGDARVALSTYWQDRPAVLIFLRHFG